MRPRLPDWPWRRSLATATALPLATAGCVARAGTHPEPMALASAGAGLIGGLMVWTIWRLFKEA